MPLLWSAVSAAQVPGPRESLTFKNVGLYGGFTEYSVSAESPFDFLVVPAEGPFEGGDNTRWSEWLKKARKNGKRVIVDLNPQVKTADGKYTNITLLGNKADDAALDAMIRVIGEFFAQVDVREVYAVTLSEEQVYWNGQAENLNKLYDKMKAKYDVPVYQWYTASSTGTSPGIVFPNLKSDGWVADEYHLDQPNMEQTMRSFSIQQKPFIQIIWAGGEKATASVPFILSRFWQQVEVCRKYDIPTGYFTWYGEGGSWGMDKDAPASLKRIFDLTLQVASRANSQSSTVGNQQARDFVPWEIPTIKLAFASKDAKVATYREPYVVDRPVRFINDAEIRGFDNLRWDSTPVELRPRQPGKSEASIIYSFESPLSLSELRVSAPGFAKQGNEAKVSMSLLDSNGKTRRNATLSSEGVMELKIPGTELGGQRFKVVFHMSGKAVTGGEILAGINSLNVDADVHLPSEKVIELRQVDAFGGVSYEEDLRAMSIYHTAEIKNANYIVPTVSGLHANAPSKVVEVIQKFRATGKVRLTKLRVSGNADEPGRAARLGIGISANGVDVVARKMSTGAFNGDLEVDLSELKEKLHSNEFHVHVFLEGEFGLITSYSVTGNVAR